MLKKTIRKLLKYIDSEGRKNDYCTIGDHTRIGKGFLLVGFEKGKISIGNYCEIAENFRVRPRNHSYKHASMHRNMHLKNGFTDISEYKGDIEIGHACWFGDNVEILSGVKIGNGVVVGAGSVVTKDIPDFSIAVGVPAKVIKLRFQPEMISLLNKVAWWHWDEDRISLNHCFFEEDLMIALVAEVKSLIK
jgi:acetyltransferase-like isoleucine patch superfamily enzyme